MPVDYAEPLAAVNRDVLKLNNVLAHQDFDAALRLMAQIEHNLLVARGLVLEARRVGR